jgi:Tfp pilus assembly protein PilZ
LTDIDSKISLAGKVEIIDIGQGGVALRTDRKLNIGKECLITMGYHGTRSSVKGIVVRSELSGIEEKAGGDSVTIYSVGISFKEESADKVRALLDEIDPTKKVEAPTISDWRKRYVRFCITTPGETVLNFPAQFGVKEISKIGVIIQTEQPLKLDSVLLMELSINACDPVSIMGRVVSCRSAQEKNRGFHDIGVEFSDLTDRDSMLLQQLRDCLKERP